MRCNLINGRCTHCGRRTLGGECSIKPAPTKKRAGDAVEQLLSSVGITPDRWESAKQAVGLPPGCRCAARKKWLNAVSDWWRQESPRVERPVEPAAQGPTNTGSGAPNDGPKAG